MRCTGFVHGYFKDVYRICEGSFERNLKKVFKKGLVSDALLYNVRSTDIHNVTSPFLAPSLTDPICSMGSPIYSLTHLLTYSLIYLTRDKGMPPGAKDKVDKQGRTFRPRFHLAFFHTHASTKRNEPISRLQGSAFTPSQPPTERIVYTWTCIHFIR